MKRVGQFLFTFIPFLLTFALQQIVAFFVMGVSLLVEGGYYTAFRSVNFIDLFYDLQMLWISDRFNTYLMVTYAILNIAIFGLWYYARYGGCYLPDPKKVFHPLSFLGIVMLVPGLQYLTLYIVSFTASIFPHALEVYEELLESAGLDSALTVGMFFYSVLLAPIAEELIFRGVTMRQAQKCLSFGAANLFQAILFGVFHMNLIQGVYAFCLGLFLGYVCEKSGSIYNAILLHMLFNFWGTVISQFLPMSDTLFSFLFWFLFAVAMTAGGVAVFTAGTRHTSQQQSATQDNFSEM